MKYIIEIEDEPFVRKSCLHGEEAVYRAKGFKSLVFDQTGLEKLTPANEIRWIPVSERLPDNSDDVLVYFEYYRYGTYSCLYQSCGIGNYSYFGSTSSWMINHETGWRELRVIAWMPLPEPYEEKVERS